MAFKGIKYIADYSQMVTFVLLSNYEVKEYYDEKSSTYDDYSKQLWFRAYDAVTWKITEPYVPKDSRALIFDAAGGTGKWSIQIAKCGPKVVLGDISEGMLEVAKDKIAQAGLQDRIETKRCDLHKLDFDDETFDMVFCEHALCFIHEQETVIKELVRVLKKNHPLIISAQNRYVLSLMLVSQDVNYASKVLSKETQFIMRNRLKVYALSPSEFQQLLENTGIKIERMFGKIFTMPLGLSYEKWTSENYTEDFLKQILSLEFALINNHDAVPLGGHIQAIGYKEKSN